MRVGKGTFFVLDKLHVGVSDWDVILDNNTPSCDLHACFLYYMVLKGTVSPVLSRLKVVLLNIIESGEVPLVV